MELNRRSVLLTLGTISACSGAALSTGAFSSLNANRTTTINTATDAEAVLSLVVDTERSGLSGGGGNIIELNFSHLNQNAITTFGNALTIQNNGSRRVEITFDDTNGILQFQPGNKDLDPDGGSVAITIIVDLKNHSANNAPDEITVSADSD